MEVRERRPTVDLILGSEIVFASAARHIFPAFYSEIEDRVLAQAKELYHRLELRTDLSSQEKADLLRSMIARAEAHDPSLWL
jgi:hypothetical protein